MQRIGLAFGVLCAMLGPAAPAVACSAEQPSFEVAIATASAIARVVVEEVAEYGEPPAGETFRVVRVLKGQLPAEVHLDDPRSGLCGDSIGYYAPAGSEVIVAFGVPFYDTLVNPAWKATDSRVEPVIGFGAPTPEGIATLDELERVILAALPDTAMPVAGGGDAPLVGGVLLLLAAASIAVRRLRAA